MGQDDVSCSRIIAPPFLVSMLFPFVQICLCHNSVTAWDIFMQLYRHMSEVSTACCVKE